MDYQEQGQGYYVFSSAGNYLGSVDQAVSNVLIVDGARKQNRVLVLCPGQYFDREVFTRHSVSGKIMLLALDGNFIAVKPSRFVEMFGIEWDPSIHTYGEALRRGAEIERTLDELRDGEEKSALEKEAERLDSNHFDNHVIIAKRYAAHPSGRAIGVVETFLSEDPSPWQPKNKAEKETRESVLQGVMSVREVLENAQENSMCARLVLLAVSDEWRNKATSKWLLNEAKQRVISRGCSKSDKQTISKYVQALIQQRNGKRGELDALSVAKSELRKRPFAYGNRNLAQAILREPNTVDLALKGWETDTCKSGVIIDCLIDAVEEERRERLEKERIVAEERRAQLEREKAEREKRREEEKRIARAKKEENKPAPLREGELIKLAERSLVDVGANEAVKVKMIRMVSPIDPSNKQLDKRSKRQLAAGLGARAVRFIKANPKKFSDDRYGKRILKGKTDNPYTSILSNNRLAASLCDVLAMELTEADRRNFVASPSGQRQQKTDEPKGPKPKNEAHVDFDSPGYTLFICKGIFACEKKHHTIVPATGYITSLKGRPIGINVNHCLDCNTFFISQNEYEHYRDVYGPVLGNFEFSSFRSGSGHSFDDFADRSILNLCGYSVSQADGYTADERQLILANILDRGIVSKPRLINYLEFFIRVNRNAVNKRTAVKKWSDDLNWVRNYRINAQRKFRVSSIRRAR